MVHAGLERYDGHVSRDASQDSPANSRLGTGDLDPGSSVRKTGGTGTGTSGPRTMVRRFSLEGGSGTRGGQANWLLQPNMCAPRHPGQRCDQIAWPADLGRAVRTMVTRPDMTDDQRVDRSKCGTADQVAWRPQDSDHANRRDLSSDWNQDPELVSGLRAPEFRHLQLIRNRRCELADEVLRRRCVGSF